MPREAAYRSTSARAAAWLLAAATALCIAVPLRAQQLVPPAFSSTPITAATVDVAYTYSVTTTDPEVLDTIAITAPTLPAWLTLTDNGNRTATLAGTPAATDVGDHPVVLEASDGANAVQQAFTITVAAAPVPVAADDSYSTPQDKPLDVKGPDGVLANDTSPSGDGKDLTAVLVTGPVNGTLQLGPKGDFKYTPSPGFVGSDSFTYEATDGAATSAPATVTLDVTNTNDPPAAAADAYSTAEDTQLTVDAATGVLANDTDADGDPLTAVLESNVSHGTLALAADGSFVYMPAASFSGADSFRYRASDGMATSGPTTVTLTIAAGNTPPVAVADSYALNAGTVLTVLSNDGVLKNDTDSEHDALTAQLETSAASGTVALNPDGSFTYTPNQGFAGTDSFTYQANDGTALSAAATVTLTVSAVNGPPTAVADAYTTAEGSPLTVAAVNGVLANDTDPNGDPLTAQLAGAVSNGTLALNADGSFGYTPAPNFSGTVTFTYTASDGSSASAPATVTITVSSVNQPPTITSTPPTSVAEGAAYHYTLTASDPDGDPLTIAAPQLPAWLTFTPPATIAGTPTQANVGTHSVTLTVSDGVAPAVSQSFQITVQAVADAPVVAAIPDQSATELTPFTLNLAQFVTDSDTPPASISYAAVGALPPGFTLSSAGVLSGTPPLGQGGTSFDVRFIASDGSNTAQGQLRLTVLGAGQTDLAASVTAAPNPAAVGAQVTWTFAVANKSAVDVGGASLTIAFTGDVPFALDDVSAAGCTAAPSGNGTQVACTLGPIAGGATAQVTLTGSATLAGDVAASATVAVSGPIPIDNTPGNDHATGSVSIAQQVSSAPAQQIPGLSARAAATGDLDGDGFDDLVVATGSGQGTVVLANIVDPADANKRKFDTTPVALGGEALGNAVALADLDRDGDLDVVEAAGAGAPNRVFLNDGGKFESHSLGSAPAGSVAVAVGDVNGDGFADVVLAGPGGTVVYVNSGSGGTFDSGTALGDANATAVVLADLFGDPLPELVVAYGNGDAAVYRNNGGTFALETRLATGAATSVAAADFNGDSRIDLVFGRDRAPAGDTPANLVWLNTSTASGQFFQADRLGAAATVGVTVADFDLDGDADVLAVNHDGEQLFANAGAGSGTFTLAPQQLGSAAASMAVAGRFSVDERVDVAVVANGGIDVYYNDGSGHLGVGDATGPTIQLVGTPTISLSVGDTYTDPGATAADAVDGDVSSRIHVESDVDTAVIGTYTVTYTATDLSGNPATPVTRSVNVQAHAAQGGGGGALGLFDWLALGAAALLRRRVAARPAARRANR